METPNIFKISGQAVMIYRLLLLSKIQFLIVYQQVFITIGNFLFKKRTKQGINHFMDSVWVTNLVKDPNGDKDTHGPDCIETSHTFKVTSGSHTNAAGDTEYTESIDDNNIYHPEHYKGCFGLSVDYPKKGSTFNVGHHIHIQALRDSASQTDSLIKVELFEGDKFRGVAWTGNEPIQNSFTLKDHLKLENINPEADYRYKLYVTSKHSNEICTFQSKTFHIQG